MGEAGIIGGFTHLHVCLQCWLSVDTSTGTIHCIPTCISFVELFELPTRMLVEWQKSYSKRDMEKNLPFSLDLRLEDGTVSFAHGELFTQH